MKQTKTLNVGDDVHRQVKIAAAQQNIPLGMFVEAVIRVGLNRPKEVTRLLAENTKPEPDKG